MQKPKLVLPLWEAISSCRTVNQLLKSVVREIRTLRSVRAGGRCPPLVVRWKAREQLPIPVNTIFNIKQASNNLVGCGHF